MSRYELDPRPEAEGVTRAVVGWDRPLQTFFAQIFMIGLEDEEEATIWVGTEPGELPTAAAAIAVVAPYAIVPADLAERLEDDLRATAGFVDGPEQRRAKDALFGRLH